MPAADPRLRARTALLLAGGYIALIGVIVLWPSRVDQPLEATLERWLVPVASFFGVPVELGYKALEVGANVLLFLPLGFIAALALGARRAWWAVLGGLVLSGAAELGQWVLLPGRTPSVRDVLADTVGVAIGAGIGALVLVVVARRRLSRSSPGSS